jgi:hypothetical protein
MTSTSTIRAVTTDATDNGKFITIHGLNATGREIKETLTLNASANPTTTASFASVSQVVKDVTNSQVELLQVSGSLTFGRYYGNETNPEYRRIRATVASTINLSYRRRTIEVSGIDDYIPLKNPLAVIQAVRSVHYRFKERLADAQAAQADAFTLLGDEQTVRTIKNIPVGPVVENLANDPLKYPTA